MVSAHCLIRVDNAQFESYCYIHPCLVGETGWDQMPTMGRGSRECRSRS